MNNEYLGAAGRFLLPFARGQTGPIRKFIFDMVTGMLMAQHVHLAAIGRALDERDDARHARQIAKRLSARLNSKRFRHEALRTLYLEWLARRAGRENSKNVVVAVDYTDLAKKAARLNGALELASRCWDGSRREKGTGYPVVQMVIDHPAGVSYPLDLFPFSLKKEGKRGQPKVFLERLRLMAPRVGRRALWAFDRGFDGETYLQGFDKIGFRWVVRLKAAKGSRLLFREDGRGDTVQALLPEVKNRYEDVVVSTTRSGRERKRKIQVGWTVVRLSDRKNDPAPAGPERTLVVVRGFGKQPMVVLAHERLGGEADVRRILDAYHRRWTAEVATWVMKKRDGWGLSLEHIAVHKGQSVERMLLLSMLAMSYLADLHQRRPTLSARASRAARAGGPRRPSFPVNRLIRGAGTLLKAASPAARHAVRARVGGSRRRLSAS